ncbi:hypothetical protein OS493_001316 [Desmophyllum pertusum]|uniref:Uncharacterized protein n=1 Tax=Desmophyllum pertusum TaxID=174260 RepID=A0A9X0D5U1_9CNID|nr:hypothetical protein OS493_001316 [Desmophyllum pertusum]
MANQSDDSGIVKCGPLIDFEDDSPKETHTARHSMPIKYNVLEMTPCSPDGTQEAQDNGSWSWKTESKCRTSIPAACITARLDMVDSRISAIESQSSRSLLNETTEKNKETTNVHLRDPTVGLETGTEYLQTSVTGQTGVSNPTLPSRAPCLQPSKLEPSPVHYGPQGAQECKNPVAQTQPDKPKIRPATFSGNTSWDDYLAQFELVAEINRWNDSMKTQ